MPRPPRDPLDDVLEGDDELGSADEAINDEADADDEGMDADEEQEQEEHFRAGVGGTAPRKKRKKKEVTPLFGVRPSHATKTDSANAQRNAADRARLYAARFKKALDLRADIKVDVLCRVILLLSETERQQLRETCALQQEIYVAKRDCVEFLQQHCFNALNAIDLRACEALAVRCMQRIAYRMSHDEAGKRIVVCQPPNYTGLFNPLTRQSNRDCGIKWEHKAVLAPLVFPRHSEIVAAGQRVLDGRKLHLAFEFDGAAWDFLVCADDLLAMLERDVNILTLPPGVKRVLQLIFDGHGFLSRSGAVRFTLRSPHTKHDHNSTRNARDPIFFIGTDKHAYLEQAVRIGGPESLHAHCMSADLMSSTAETHSSWDFL